MVFIRLLIKKKKQSVRAEKKSICFTIFIPSQTRICPDASGFTPTCCHVGLLLVKRLDMLFLRHRKVSGRFIVHTLRIYFFSGERSKKYPDSVACGRSHIRKKNCGLKIFEYVWTGHIININLVPRLPVHTLGQQRKTGPRTEFIPVW